MYEGFPNASRRPLTEAERQRQEQLTELFTGIMMLAAVVGGIWAAAKAVSR